MSDEQTEPTEGGPDPITEIKSSLVGAGYDIDPLVSSSENTGRVNYSVHPAGGYGNTSVDFFRDMEQITTRMGIKQMPVPDKLMVQVFYRVNPHIKRLMLAAFFFSSDTELPLVHRRRKE